jgi:hypothetical protein
MTPEELQQCLQESFGYLKPPYFKELGTTNPERLSVLPSAYFVRNDKSGNYLAASELCTH